MSIRHRSTTTQNGLWPGPTFVTKFPEIEEVMDQIWDLGKNFQAACQKISPIYCLQKLSFPLSVVYTYRALVDACVGL